MPDDHAKKSSTTMIKLPDQEARTAEVQALGEQAREHVIPSSAGSEQRTTAIHMAEDNGIPFEYILHIHTAACKSCECIEQHSELFAHYGYKSRMGSSTVKHLRRTDAPRYNLPVRTIFLPPREIFFCTDCETHDLSHLPPPPEPARLTDAPDALMRNGKKMYGEPEKKAKAPAKPSMKSTSLDDLI